MASDILPPPGLYPPLATSHILPPLYPPSPPPSAPPCAERATAAVHTAERATAERATAAVRTAERAIGVDKYFDREKGKF